MLKHFGSNVLLMGSIHSWVAISGVIRRYEHIDCLRQIFFRGHGERKVYEPAFSKIRHHLCRISTHDPININMRFLLS